MGIKIISRNESERYPLPEGWTKEYTLEGRPFFVNHFAQETSWIDPRDSVWKKKRWDEITDDENLTKIENDVSIPSGMDVETPFGWDVAVDDEYGVYFIDHLRHQNVFESPRRREDAFDQVQEIGSELEIKRNQDLQVHNEIRQRREEIQNLSLEISNKKKKQERKDIKEMRRQIEHMEGVFRKLVKEKEEKQAKHKEIRREIDSLKARLDDERAFSAQVQEEIRLLKQVVAEKKGLPSIDEDELEDFYATEILPKENIEKGKGKGKGREKEKEKEKEKEWDGEGTTSASAGPAYQGKPKERFFAADPNPNRKSLSAEDSKKFVANFKAHMAMQRNLYEIGVSEPKDPAKENRKAPPAIATDTSSLSQSRIFPNYNSFNPQSQPPKEPPPLPQPLDPNVKLESSPPLRPRARETQNLPQDQKPFESEIDRKIKMQKLQNQDQNQNQNQNQKQGPNGDRDVAALSFREKLLLFSKPN